MHRAAPLLAFLLAACASAGETIPPATSTRSLMRIETAEGPINVEMYREGNVTSAAIAAPAARVWEVLPKAFGDLGLTANVVDPSTKTLGMANQRVRRISGQRPSAFLDCGAGLAGSYADIYDVNLSVHSQVIPAGETASTLRILVQASAKDPAHSSTPVSCSTRARLEERLRDAVAQQLAAGTD